MNTKATVLFVDDEERIVNLLKIMFRSTYNVLTATNGDEALAIIASQPVHVIVSDQRMPEMMGIDLLTRARSLSPSTMRVLLTGYSDLAAIVGSVNEAEVFRFLNKPWNQEEIKTIIGDAAAIAMASPMAAAVKTPVGAATGAIANAVPSGQRRGVLVIDDNEFDRSWVKKTLESAYAMHTAGSIQDALKVLEQHEIAVIVAEATVNGDTTSGFLNVLKQQYPLITTVMLSGAADSDLVIKLINQAQICRFSPKPIKAGAFTLAVRAAMAVHEQFRENPKLMARHKVARSTDAESATIASSLSRTLASLRARFSFFSN